jgi:hypothetical protein
LWEVEILFVHRGSHFCIEETDFWRQVRGFMSRYEIKRAEDECSVEELASEHLVWRRQGLANLGWAEPRINTIENPGSLNRGTAGGFYIECATKVPLHACF